MRLTGDCIEGGYFRASRPGGRRCVYRLGLGWWVYKIERVLRRVARLTAPREATLGNRVSEGVVAFTVWGLGGGLAGYRRRIYIRPGPSRYGLSRFQPDIGDSSAEGRQRV